MPGVQLADERRTTRERAALEALGKLKGGQVRQVLPGRPGGCRGCAGDQPEGGGGIVRYGHQGTGRCRAGDAQAGAGAGEKTRAVGTAGQLLRGAGDFATMKEEMILVVRRETLEKLGMWHGLNFEVERYLPVPAGAGEQFLHGPAPGAETNPCAQAEIIPYVLLTCMVGRCCITCGARKAGEQRLGEQGIDRDWRPYE